MFINAIARFEGGYNAFGDKSITHRAIILLSCIPQQSKVYNANLCHDCLSTINCMRELGAQIEVTPDVITIMGCNEFQTAKVLNCGNCATTMRLLMGLLSAKNIFAMLIGDGDLSERPMQSVADALNQMGANVKTTDGHAPVYIEPSKLSGISYEMEMSNFQLKDAILLAGMFAKGKTVIIDKYRAHNNFEQLLATLNANIVIDEKKCTVTISKGEMHVKDISVSGDISTAAYLIALGALKGFTRCNGVGISLSSKALLDVFKQMGIRFFIENQRKQSYDTLADLVIHKSEIKPIKIDKKQLPNIVETLPLICVMLAFAKGKSKIAGVRDIRYKEGGRAIKLAEMLNSLGCNATEKGDALIINGVGKINGGFVNTHGDYRTALSAVVALSCSEIGGEIDNAECINIGFAGFLDIIKQGYSQSDVKQMLRLAQVGRDVRYSKGNLVHNFIITALGHKCSYDNISVSEDFFFGKVKDLLKYYDGFNVAAPYKQKIYPVADTISGDALEYKSINVVRVEHHNYATNAIAYNTDGLGFYLSLLHENIDVEGKKVLVIGAGGTARSVIYTLFTMGADVYVINRTHANAVSMQEDMNCFNIVTDLSGMYFYMAVNCTQLGSGELENVSYLTKDEVACCEIIYDTNYNPETNKLLEYARICKKKRLNGAQMLFFQAYLGDCIFLGIKPDDKQAFDLYEQYSQALMLGNI